MRRRRKLLEGSIPPGLIRGRCVTCGKDTSVEFVICCLAQMYAEEKWFVWQYLRKNQALRGFRELKKQAKTIT
jgi:hypothetical protein